MIESETVYRVVCDECGYPYDDGSSPTQAREYARSGGHGVRELHERGGFDLCHDCTPEGNAEHREHFIRLAEIAWAFWGLNADDTRRIAGQMWDRGEIPQPEPPFEVLMTGLFDREE